MSAAARARHCPRCGHVDDSSQCARCGTYLYSKRHNKPWLLTPKMIQRIHVVAMKQKGLSREEYKLRLGAVGVGSCKELNETQYTKFMKALASLPDAQAPS